MAGIIVDVSSDIQKLQKLKAEIASVKQEVKGIDIRVRLDIKESVETRLKALNEQYTALVMKIAEAEGKIKLSVYNINKASDAIIKAQEKMSKVTGGTTQQVSPSSTPSNTSAKTVSIQAQAKAYEDLRTEINAVLGTREANIKRMLDEKKAIDLINAEIKRITKSQGDSIALSSTQQKRLELLNNSLLTHKTALAEVRQVLSNNAKMDNAAVTSMNELSQSLSRMRVVYRELTEEERKSPFGKELLSSIQQADAEIKELDASIGNHARNVGNYKQKWDGLGMSIQQIGREFPSLAYGPKVFFSAISNNLPILADELKRAKNEFNALRAQGKEATPVWKQIVSSLFSWQSALTVGITLLTLYGDKLVDWVSESFKAKDATKELLSAEQEMALARKKAILDSTKEKTELDLLYNKLKDTTLSTKERSATVSEWINKYPQYSNIMNGELVSLSKLGYAYKSLSKHIVETAKAKAYSDKITELTKKREDAEFRRLNSLNSLERSRLALAINDSDLQKSITENAQNQYDAIAKEVENYDSNIAYIQKKIKLDDLFPQPEKGTYDYWTQQVQIADTALKQIKDSYLKVLQSGNKEKIKLIPDDVVKRYNTFTDKKVEAEKALKVYDSSSNQESAAEKAAKAAESLRVQQEKYNILMDEQARKRVRAEEDAANEIRQAEIDADKDGAEKVLKQRKLNHDKEIQAIVREADDRKQAVINAGRAAFEAAEETAKAEDPKHVKKTFDKEKFVSSEAAQKEFLQINKVAQGKVDAENAKYNRGDDLANLLDEYQDFADQRLAIEKKFNEDIKVLDAQRKTALENGDMEQIAKIDRSKIKAEKKKKEDLSGVAMNEFKADIDWATLFGNLDVLSPEALNKLRDKLKAFIETAADKLNPEDLKVLSEAMTNVELTIADKTPYEALKVGLSGYKVATEDASKAQEKLNKLEKEGKGGTKEYKDATKELTEAQRRRAESLKTITQATNNIGEKGQQVVQAGSDIVDMLTSLGVSVPESLTGALDGIGQVMDSLASIDLMKPMSIVTGITGTLAGIGKTIGSIFGGSSNSTKYYENLKEQLDAINEIYQKIIDKSKEEITFGGGFASVQAANDALDTYYKKVENYRKLAEAGGNAGGSAGSHRYSTRANDRLSNYWGAMSKVIGKNISSVQEMYNLTSDQLYLLQTKFPEAWGKIPSEITDSLNAIIDCKDEAQELTDALNAAMTGIDTDSFYNGFIDSLADMDTSFEDMCDNFEDYLRKSIIAGLVASQYRDRIDGLYKQWSEAAKSDNKVTKEESEKLKDDYQQIVKDMMNDRDQMAKDFDWGSSSSSYSSSSRSFQTMSQDTGEELNGRFTALQIAGEEIKNQNVVQSQSLNLLTVKADAILSMNTEMKNIADDTRDIIANSYLELVQISENTGAIIKPIQQMQRDMAEVKKNTSKL